MLGARPEAACHGGAARQDRRMGAERGVDCQQNPPAPGAAMPPARPALHARAAAFHRRPPLDPPGSALRALSTPIRKVRQKWLFIGFGPRWLGESAFWLPFARLRVYSLLSVQLPLLMQQLSVRRTGLSISTARATTLTTRPRHL